MEFFICTAQCVCGLEREQLSTLLVLETCLSINYHGQKARKSERVERKREEGRAGHPPFTSRLHEARELRDEITDMEPQSSHCATVHLYRAPVL